VTNDKICIVSPPAYHERNNHFSLITLSTIDTTTYNLEKTIGEATSWEQNAYSLRKVWTSEGGNGDMYPFTGRTHVNLPEIPIKGNLEQERAKVILILTTYEVHQGGALP
jgi:hypothetical protein